ncbi:MAG TPA: hypothetical protein DCM50_00875, partial [Stenotrophomonas sp.]|nr:hypothetical protein [Stenotrophomonas sp.]
CSPSAVRTPTMASANRSRRCPRPPWPRAWPRRHHPRWHRTWRAPLPITLFPACARCS